MGEPPKTQDNFEQKYSVDVNDYFPHSTTLHVGDSVKWMPGFHTVDIPARGQRSLSFVIPSATKASGQKDEAGNPFWFNDQVNELTFNPLVAKVTKSATYNGKKRVDSGINFAGRPSPFTVKFTKPGTYTYYCDVHPGMKGVVHVVSKTAKAPTAKDDKQAVARQVTQDLATAAHVGHTVPPTATILMGASGKGNVEYYGFFGPKSPIKVGSTVTFKMGKGVVDQHTATTDTGASSTPPPPPGGNDTIPDTYLAGLASTFQGNGPFNATSTYGSDQAGGTPASLSPQLHGNGFWNTGVLASNGAFSLPSNATVRFDTPGSYTFYCLIHNFMHITVQVTS
jgi:plastocyanin